MPPPLAGWRGPSEAGKNKVCSSDSLLGDTTNPPPRVFVGPPLFVYSRDGTLPLRRATPPNRGEGDCQVCGVGSLQLKRLSRPLPSAPRSSPLLRKPQDEGKRRLLSASALGSFDICCQHRMGASHVPQEEIGEGGEIYTLRKGAKERDDRQHRKLERG